MGAIIKGRMWTSEIPNPLQFAGVVFNGKLRTSAILSEPFFSFFLSFFLQVWTAVLLCRRTHAYYGRIVVKTLYTPAPTKSCADLKNVCIHQCVQKCVYMYTVRTRFYTNYTAEWVGFFLYLHIYKTENIRELQCMSNHTYRHLGPGYLFSSILSIKCASTMYMNPQGLGASEKKNIYIYYIILQGGELACFHFFKSSC